LLAVKKEHIKMTDYQKDIAEVINNQTEAEEHAQLRCELHTKECDRRDKIWSKRYWFSMILVAVISASLGGWKVYSTGPDFMGMNSFGEASYKELLMASQKNDQHHIWFDRKRLHSDSGFAKIDDEFPAQYEIWEKDKLIERWHWSVEEDARTHKFGDYILRCIANYDSQNTFIGFSQYQMNDYPSGNAQIVRERATKANSLYYTIDKRDGRFSLSGPNANCVWIGGKFVFAEKRTNGFPHGRGEIEPMDLIKNDDDINYVKHISTVFKFLEKDLLEPYSARKEFAELVENAPEKSKKEWKNFVLKINEDKESTLNYTKSQHEKHNKDHATVKNDPLLRHN